MDQSKASLDKGGVATLDAFLGLIPLDGSVRVQPAIFPTNSRAKGPAVRCVSSLRKKTTDNDNDDDDDDDDSTTTTIEVANVDSLEKVYQILTRYMKVQVSFRSF